MVSLPISLRCGRATIAMLRWVALWRVSLRRVLLCLKFSKLQVVDEKHYAYVEEEEGGHMTVD